MQPAAALRRSRMCWTIWDPICLLQGKPIKVLASRVSNAFNWSDSTYGIYLVTEDSTNRVHPESFLYHPTYNIRYEMVGDIPQGFQSRESHRRSCTLLREPLPVFHCFCESLGYAAMKERARQSSGHVLV